MSNHRDRILRALVMLLDASYLDETPTDAQSDKWRAAVVEARRSSDAMHDALRAILADVEQALAEAENIASGRRGMQCEYNGPFAASIRLPSTVRELRRIAKTAKEGLGR